MDYNAAALEMHAKYPGKLTVNSLFEVKDRDALSTAYTPGVAEPCRQIKANPDDVYKYTFKGRTVAVVTNGTAVLGLGNIGPEAGLPVMEGKCVLFKEFGGVDALSRSCRTAPALPVRPSSRCCRLPVPKTLLLWMNTVSCTPAARRALPTIRNGWQP